jgi:hypothetical protein
MLLCQTFRMFCDCPDLDMSCHPVDKVDRAFVMEQAYGAVAPKRRHADRRFITVIGAAALAMALPALILVASGGVEDTQASAAEVVWTELADPERVALAQSLMESNAQRPLFTQLQGPLHPEMPSSSKRLHFPFPIPVLPPPDPKFSTFLTPKSAHMFWQNFVLSGV